MFQQNGDKKSLIQLYNKTDSSKKKNNTTKPSSENKYQLHKKWKLMRKWDHGFYSTLTENSNQVSNWQIDIYAFVY